MLATLTLSTGLEAADLGGRAAYGGDSPVFDSTPWTGAYIGLSVGRQWGSTRIETATGNGTIDTSGADLALTGGYSWQSGRFVMGGEIEGGLVSLAGSNGAGSGIEAGWMLAARARAGMIVAPALYVYAMAGLAAADLELEARSVTRSDTLVGYQLGVGGEYRLSRTWGLRLDYLYTDLGEKDRDFPGFRQSFDTDYHTVRAGITMRF